MALTWSVEDIENHEEVTTLVLTHDIPERGLKAGDKIWHPVTESLVWASLSTGIGRIKAENAAEVFARIRLIEKLNGPLLIRAVDPETGKRPEGSAAFITPEEIHQHIGLSTNASFTDETRAKWLKRWITHDLDNFAGVYRRETDKATA